MRRGLGIDTLYNMEADPRETRDLSRDSAHAPAMEELKSLLIGWLLKSDLARGSRGGEALPAKEELIVNAIK